MLERIRLLLMTELVHDALPVIRALEEQMAEMIDELQPKAANNTGTGQNWANELFHLNLQGVVKFHLYCGRVKLDDSVMYGNSA